jgi:glycine C-acetyltransferase
VTFRHNDVGDLRARLAEVSAGGRFAGVFVMVEGVYSMDGDLAPLDQIVPLCRRFKAFLVVDDAHGTGVLGANGRGAAEHFGVEGQIDLVMATFSKALGVAGGALAGSAEVIEYLRFASRPYFFSASPDLMTVAAVLAGLDVIEQQPRRRRTLHENVRRLVAGLRAAGVDCRSLSAIVPVRVGRPIRAVAQRMHRAGIFVNAVEYPAVPKGAQQFRISVSSLHRPEDIDTLVAALARALAAEGVRPADRPG